MTKSKLFSKCQVLYLCFLLHKFLKTLDFSKCQVLDLVIFALIFSEFGYVPRKSWGHRKNLEHSQIQKKSKANMTNTVQFLVGFEIKPVRTGLKSNGIHRLLIYFRADIIIYSFQAFFLPHCKKLQNHSSVFFLSF